MICCGDSGFRSVDPFAKIPFLVDRVNHGWQGRWEIWCLCSCTLCCLMWGLGSGEAACNKSGVLACEVEIHVYIYI